MKVIVDYCHNAAGLQAVGDFVEQMTSQVRDHAPPGFAPWTANLRVAVVATAGDRRDEDMRELGRVAARYFDDVIIREDVNTRGRNEAKRPRSSSKACAPHKPRVGAPATQRSSPTR